MEYSKNKKLNGLLNEIETDLLDFGLDEVKRYYDAFKNEPDYNIASYANLLVYYNDIRQLYKRHNYKSVDHISDNKLWDIYRRQCGYVVRQLMS